MVVLSVSSDVPLAHDGHAARFDLLAVVTISVAADHVRNVVVIVDDKAHSMLKRVFRDVLASFAVHDVGQAPGARRTIESVATVA